MVLSTTAGDLQTIAGLNDTFRKSFLGGSVCVTAAVHVLGAEFVRLALIAVRDYAAFSPDNDPHGEHDFGPITVEGRNLFWKIEYFDPTMTRGAADPADVEATRRVLTVMLQDEY